MLKSPIIIHHLLKLFIYLTSRSRADQDVFHIWHIFTKCKSPILSLPTCTYTGLLSLNIGYILTAVSLYHSHRPTPGNMRHLEVRHTALAGTISHSGMTVGEIEVAESKREHSVTINNDSDRPPILTSYSLRSEIQVVVLCNSYDIAIWHLLSDTHSFVYCLQLRS